MSPEETSPISYPLSPIFYLDRPRATPWRAGVLVGPTAVGKSAVAQWIAERVGAAILSADSMLVYRGMDIGTAKPTPEERGEVPYFGIDCVDSGEPFSTGAWLSFVLRQLAEYEGGKREEGRGKREQGAGNREEGMGVCSQMSAEETSPISHPLSPISYLASSGAPQLIVAGGTGLYVNALLNGLDAQPSNPAARARWTALFESGGLSALRAAVDANPAARALLPDSDLANPRRLIRALERAESSNRRIVESSNRLHSSTPPLPHSSTFVAGLTMPRDRLAARIMTRIDKMFKEGLVEEAIAVREASGGLSSTACGAIGYAEALAVADGKMTRAEAIERIAARTRQLAKRQFTWFRHQINVEWVEVGESDTPATLGPKIMEIWKRNGYFEI